MARKKKNMGKKNGWRFVGQFFLTLLVMLAVLVFISVIVGVIIAIQPSLETFLMPLSGFVVLASLVIAVCFFIRRRKKSKTKAAEHIDNYGIDDPEYKFSEVDGYKQELFDIREKQKEMVKAKTACFFPRNFLYNNDLKKGQQMVGDWMRLALRAFNGECGQIIAKVTYSNVERSADKIVNSMISINKICQRIGIQISSDYANLKLDELRLAYKYEEAKQQEKDMLRQIREEEREKAKVEKELEEAREKILKDITHTSNEIEMLQYRLRDAGDEDAPKIKARIRELLAHQESLNDDLESVEERAANARAGYVYIISNIGSFGEHVYKIGVTRRLEPQERVDELGSASVPFRFDVHAFIFSTDAYQLESALHRAFEHRRVNKVNLRKEFFRVSLDEIENEVRRNHSDIIDFRKTIEAQEFRETQKLEERLHGSRAAS